MDTDVTHSYASMEAAVGTPWLLTADGRGSVMQYTLSGREGTPQVLFDALQVHGRVSDIWRSFVAERLFWDIGMHVAFSPPLVTQLRTPHNPLADMAAENDLYFKSQALVDFLR